MKYYNNEKKQLIDYREHDSGDIFWDTKWNSDNFKDSVTNNAIRDKFISKMTKKFIKPSKQYKILEGGCGMGHFVYSLDLCGYDSYGIDFASNTVNNININFPELKVVHGDVNNLPFKDNYFHGYWSLGVIEHNFYGYKNILKEMQRVLVPGGYVFITFPHISLLRKLKIKLGFYKKNITNGDLVFYQFLLDYKKVLKDLKKIGFICVYKNSYDAVRGIQEEICNSIFIRKVYSENFFLYRLLRFFINKCFSWFCGHIILLVFKKVYDKNT